MAINNKINPYQWKVKFQISVVPSLQQSEAVGLYKFEVFNHKTYVTVEYETKSFEEGVEVANKHKTIIQNLMLERMIYLKHFGNVNINISDLELLNENDLANAGLQTTPPVRSCLSDRYDIKDDRKILTISHNFWKRGFQSKSKGYESDALRIADWLQRSKEETDEIKSFILAWIAFNGLYGLFASINGKENLRDADKFEYIIMELLVNDASHIGNESALNKLESYDVSSGGENTNWSNKLKIERTNINKDDIKVLQYAMRCIYGVRKQVFHEAPQPMDIMERANTCKSILIPVAATCLRNLVNY